MTLETLVCQRSNVRFAYRGANYGELAAQPLRPAFDVDLSHWPRAILMQISRLCSPIKLSGLGSNLIIAGTYVTDRITCISVNEGEGTLELNGRKITIPKQRGEDRWGWKGLRSRRENRT